MAGETIFRCTGVAAIHVTLCAIDGTVRAAQRKSGEIVIELCRLPGIVAMTNPAIFGEISGKVIGIRRVLKIILMTREAIGRRAGETIVEVTLIASGRRVRAKQRKTCFIVIKTLAAQTRGLPAGDRAAVALLAAQ